MTYRLVHSLSIAGLAALLALWGTAALAQEANPAPTAPEAAVAKASADGAAKESTAPADTQSAARADEQPSAGSKHSETGSPEEKSKPAASQKDANAVTAEFGAPTGAGPRKGGQPGSISFNFRSAPWELVLRKFAELADLTLEMNEIPAGTFNYFDSNSYSTTEALDILNGALMRRGFAMVRRDNFLVVINLDLPLPLNLIPEVPVGELPHRGKNELLSVVLTLNDFDAKSAAEEVKELLGPQGKVTPLPKVNRLLVTDIGSNLRRIHELLVGMGHVEGNGFRSFKMQHIAAVDAERILRDLFSLPARGSAASRGNGAAIPPAAAQPARNDWGRGGGDWGRGGDWWRGGDQNRGGDSGRGGRDRDRNGDGDRRNGDRSPQAPQAQPQQPATPKIQMTVDNRTNSLLVTANAEDLSLVEKAIKTIDVPDSAGNNAFSRGNNAPQLEVYALETADPRTVVDMLNATMPGLVIFEDTKTRRINVYATPEDQAQVRDTIRRLDSGAGESASVVPLRKLDPVAVAVSLRSLFGGANKADAPSIEADAVGRQLMLRGSPDQIAQIRKILNDMGEDGNPAGMLATTGGPLRTISPGGRSAEELVALVQQILPQTDGSFIRIVSPSELGGRNFQRTPSELPGAGRPGSFQRREGTAPAIRRGSEPNGAPAVPGLRPSGADRSAPGVRKQVEVTLPTAARDRDRAISDDELERLSLALEEALGADELEEATDDAEEPSSEQDEAQSAEPTVKEAPETSDDQSAAASRRKEPAGENSEVRITSYGGKILVASENMEALDRIERLIQSLVHAAPNKTKWTVYYLRVADATETATILGSLFPQGSVTQTAERNSGSIFSSFSGGLSSLGGSLMDATGLSKAQALRIVPELRSNALFITGPEDQVNQVLEALEVLDAAELPESLKDRLPRMIALEHADAQEVADILKDVYNEQLEPPAQQQQQGQRGGGGFNPFAMLMGAANQNSRQRGVQLSIGVDTQTNAIVVSASEQLFRQIETLVESLDKSALEAHRTVQVVSLKNADTSIVQDALAPLLGKVTVSSTASRQNQRGSRGSPQGQTNPPSFGGGFDPGRAMMFQQMMQNRGGGGSPFGGNQGSFRGGRGGEQQNFGGGNRGGGNRGGEGRSRRGNN